jgi:hypothetical protein
VAFVATTVNVEELPVTIEVGFAVTVTVGGGPVFTVTVTVAVIDPPLPVAVAVYVVVAVGLTDVVPPAAASVTLVPVPVTVTVVAFVAVTVRVEEPPVLTVMGLAVMVTVGGVFVVVLVVVQPTINSGNIKLGITMETIRLNDWRKRAFCKVISFNFTYGSRKSLEAPQTYLGPQLRGRTSKIGLRT